MNSCSKFTRHEMMKSNVGWYKINFFIEYINN